MVVAVQGGRQKCFSFSLEIYGVNSYRAIRNHRQPNKQQTPRTARNMLSIEEKQRKSLFPRARALEKANAAEAHLGRRKRAEA